MKRSIKNIRTGELLIYTIVWLVVFLMPVILSSNAIGSNWVRVKMEWIKITPFFVVFLIHNSLLFPILFVKHKRHWYYIEIAISVAVITLLWILISRNYIGTSGPGLMKQQPGFPLSNSFPVFRPKPLPRLISEVVIISILVIGFNAAIKIAVKWQKEEQKNKDLEKEKLQTELAFLRNQVSPHFFMNTLNNIHALIDINKKNAKESVIKLSKLMRYLLYDSEKGKTTLLKEIEFIKSYVDLMKLRFSSNVKIELEFPENIPEVEIPPLLFTSLIENAFKHGVSYQSESFIGIFMELQEQQLFLKVKNSLNDKIVEETGGLGLPNLEKRLGLIYGSDYNLTHSISDKFFEIKIKIPINGN